MSNIIELWAGSPGVTWDPVLKKSISIGSHYKIVPTEGYLAWEYNPLRNYRLSENMYEKDGKYYSKKEFINIVGDITNSKDLPEGWILREAGELVDFITDELSFNLQHPVDILPQYSYDGSVNLILNDGLNIPRLINTRFTATGKNTYKIVDRKGDNDTNIYDLGTLFDVDTSLFKNVNKIPKLEYLGTSNGNMKIGNYHFYFKYADTDGNESDWVAESGLVSVFMGNTPQSVNTGLRDENSVKSVRFKLSNIDIGYSYVRIYYTRYSGDVDSNLVVQAKRIEKNFIVNNSGTCVILITGDENETDVSLEEINNSFDVILNAQTQCATSNRLFMANIHKSKIEYDRLSKLSLCFCPYKNEEPYPLSDGIDENYNINAKSDGYYDSKYIYNSTGYWPGELYRIGVVYILKDGSLSPVFNIRGATNIPIQSTDKPYYQIENQWEKYSLDEILHAIDYSEENYMIVGGSAENENAKGVIQLASQVSSDKHPFPVMSINITTKNEVIEDLKNYVKGFFFVRLKRIPLTLCQGVVVGLDNESRTPTLPTLGGVLTDLNYEKSFVESSDINDINYVSEGFLNRYRFKLKMKKSTILKKLGIALGTVLVLAAAAAATIFTCGLAGAVAAGVTLAASITTTASATAVTLATIGSVAAVTFGVAAVSIGAVEGILKIRQVRNKAEAKPIKGRKESIPDGWERTEQEDSRKLTHVLEERYIIKDPSKNTPSAIIVPDYLVNLPYYNLFLTGDEFIVKLTHEQPSTNYLMDGYFDSDLRHFYVNNYILLQDNRQYKVKLVGVPDGCPIKMIGDNMYKARAGYPEEAYKYEFLGEKFEENEDKIANSDILRGNFGSYVGMYNYKGHACDQINIMIPGYKENELSNYVLLRTLDTSAFYAISNRIDINLINKSTAILQENEDVAEDFALTCYRGDCYICQYTHRIIRNFNDPSAPYNDEIVEEDCWKENYDPDNTENYAKINLGDVNAIKLGLWLTFLLRSNYNLNIRTIDKSNIDEYLMSGNYRSYFPNYGLLAAGSQKIPDSDQYNKGFSKSVSEKYYFEVPDVPYIKQEFQNRIVFSDIHINDAYKNGYRVIRNMNHKDYPMTYGSITKMLDYNGALLIVFEHGIGLATVNNSANHTSQILGDLNVISDTYGSLWKDSIIKTTSGIYGVDTVAKKIWKVKEGLIELISDLKVLDFLNNNISLSERELTPVIGIRNVKTVYNAFKHDIMFTFYDNLYGIHEKSWNLCWNEILGIFTTFYSWIPGEMQNIDNIPFSFDRTTIKSIAKLGIGKHDNDFSDGITLSNNIINITLDVNLNYATFANNKTFELYYLNKLKESKPYIFNEEELKTITDSDKFIGFLYLDNRIFLDGKINYYIKYSLLRDNYKNDQLFEIKTIDVHLDTPINTLLLDNVESVKLSYLKLRDNIKIENLLSELYYRNVNGKKTEPLNNKPYINYPIFKDSKGKRISLEIPLNSDQLIRYLNIKAVVCDSSNIELGHYESQVAITTDFNLSLLSTDFWKHGQAGLIDITEKTHPTYWYGKQHPFEFECVVSDHPDVHKIFTNLELIANHAKPESFHYEIIGDTYDFAKDKPTMYFRQEVLKALYQYNGYDIEYNSNFLDVEPIQNKRSANFPQYYFKQDHINEIYDSYNRLDPVEGKFNTHLSGAEIVYYPIRNEFRVLNHVQAIDIDSLNLDISTSIIKANCRYLEDKWLVTINPIIITYQNEFTDNFKTSTWVNSYDQNKKLPPINIYNIKTEEATNKPIEFPNQKNNGLGEDNNLYQLYDLSDWDNGAWTPINPVDYSNRKETDVRGKFIKIKIRYSGKELAIIDYLNTIYQISFA